MTFYFSVLTVAFRMWLLPPFKFPLACITWTLFQIVANPHFDTHNNRTDSYLFLHIIRNSHRCLRNRVDKSGELILFCVTFVYALGSMLSVVRLWDLYRSTSRSNEKGKSRKSDCSCPTSIATRLRIATLAVPCVKRRPMHHPFYLCELEFRFWQVWKRRRSTDVAVQPVLVWVCQCLLQKRTALWRASSKTSHMTYIINCNITLGYLLFSHIASSFTLYVYLQLNCSWRTLHPIK